MEECKNLYCGGGGVFREVQVGITLRQACKHVNDVIRERGKEIPYTRFWEDDGLLWMDYGSWSNFFIWGSEEDIKTYVAKLEVGHG